MTLKTADGADLSHELISLQHLRKGYREYIDTMVPILQEYRHKKGKHDIRALMFAMAATPKFCTKGGLTPEIIDCLFSIVVDGRSIVPDRYFLTKDDPHFLELWNPLKEQFGLQGYDLFEEVDCITIFNANFNCNYDPQAMQTSIDISAEVILNQSREMKLDWHLLNIDQEFISDDPQRLTSAKLTRVLKLADILHLPEESE